MSLEELRAQVNAAASEYTSQSKIVANLRSQSCNSEELSAAEGRLRDFKRALDQARKRLENVVGPSNDTSRFNRIGTETLLRRRFFIAPSFEIYGGVSGLYDYGPPGCAVKNNLITTWKQHFVIEEGMLELEASCLTPAPVLKASGHVDKFHDLLVRDVETGDCFRADHLLADRLNQLIDDVATSEQNRLEMTALRERLDELSQTDMDNAIIKYKATSPDTGNTLSPSYPFNLMFETSIGPSSLIPGYLRPETAQGIFVNFKRLLEFVGGKLPFACAQIGLSFRNEISPKSSLLRVREFQQAEIEHFVNADDKSHPKFNTVRDCTVNLYGRAQQLVPPFQAFQSTIGQAVAEGIIANETLGYYIGRTNEFVRVIGMDMQHVRFRQHLEHEMAHYASDCWDLEINCSYGWTECAGLADRSAYDLANHSEKSGNQLTAREVFSEPRDVERLVCLPNKGLLGRAFRANAQVIMKEIDEMDEEAISALRTKIETDGTAEVAGFTISKDHLTFKIEKKRETGRSFYPSVIEPSFGIGRLLWCLWEHSYYVREGEEETDGSVVRAVLKLPPRIAPVKCSVLPLSKNDIFNDMLEAISASLSRAGLVNRVDDSGVSMGRRYSRSDELGIPFGITVDFESAENGTVTVRERDSTQQVRCSSNAAISAVVGMVNGTLNWGDVCREHHVISS